MTHAPIPLLVDQNLAGNLIHASSPCTTTEALVVSPSHDVSNKPIHTHHMVVRSQNHIYELKQLHLTTKHLIPQTFKLATVSQALKEPLWREGMCEELNALIKSGTWEMVPKQPYQNLVDCKWFHRVKRHPNGHVTQFKARLIARGFHQGPGVDFTDTCSPIIKPTTIRIILSIVLNRGWNIQQLDVNKTFLHEHLVEKVYLSQPPSFVDEL